jgi:NTE family protein
MKSGSEPLRVFKFDPPTSRLGRLSHVILLALTIAGVQSQASGQATEQQPAEVSPQSSGDKTPGGLDQFKVKLVPPQSGRASATDNIDTSEANLMTAPANPANLPPVTPAGRPVIGLVLEGGGAMGIAHIGVLQWLEEHHIPIDRLSGTSMGALVGGLYASGHSVADLKAIATGTALDTVFTLQVPYTDVSYRRREDRRDLPQSIELGLKGGVSLRNSLLTDRALDSFLRDQFGAYNSHAVDYDQLPIPFRCVATDLTELKPLIFRGGPLPSAVRASISIPGVFAPVDYHKHFLVDGAIMDNLPVNVVKRDLGATVVIAVHLTDTPFAEGDIGSVVGVFARAFSAGTQRNVDESVKQADVLLKPATEKFTTMDYDKAQQLIDAGYKSANDQAASLLRYALNDSDWAAYLAARHGRMRVKPGRLQILRVETTSEAPGSQGAESEVALDLAPLKKQPIDAAAITKDLRKVQANGSYEAAFETFSEATPSAITPGASSINPSATPDTGVLVRLSPIPNGPPFLLIGADLSAQNSNVTRAGFDFRLIDQNLGGFGSELRGDFRLGFLTQANVEYYRLLSTNGWFLQPRITLLREPVYEWQNQRRTSEWFEQQAGGGLDFGRTFDRNFQASIEYRNQLIRWHLTSGDAEGANLSGTAQTAVAHFYYDSTESGTISPRGMRLELKAGGTFHTVASEDAPLVEFHAGKTFTWEQKNLFGATFDLNSYLRHNIADPLRFTLGGPFRLSASSMDEYRGTDDYLVRFGYLRRLASLPTGLGQGLYLTTAYEAGEMWSPEKPAFLRQDVFSGVVVDTPLGVVTFGGSIGDAGHRKVMLSVGKLF